MLVSDYIFTKLRDEGIKEVFQVYGAATGHLVDSFTRINGIEYVALLHEQACGFAAEGYAKVNGNFGVVMATSGPGGQNLITCAANCFYDTVPCLFITGQINQQFLRPDKSIRQIGFQESDQVGCFTPVTKYSVMIKNPEDIKYELEKAISIMKSDRPGPVHLDIPVDVAGSVINVDDLIGYDDNIEKKYDTDKIVSQIDLLINDLMSSERPVILIGGGIKSSRATNELIKLLDFLQIPTYPTWNAIDVVTSDLNYYGGKVGTYGGEGRNFGIQNSDLLLSIGSRVSGRITGGNIKTFARNAKKYIVDVDSSALQKKLQQIPFDECVLSDAKLFIDLFYKKLLLNNFNKKYKEWLVRCIEWRNKYDTVTDDMYLKNAHTNPYVFIRMLSEEMKNNDIIVSDCGGNVVITNHAFKTKMGQKYFTNNGNSPMGFSFAAAIGAWFASDKKQNVVCIIGDGGMNMNIQELQSLLNYNIKIKIIILNNHIYGITKAFQETNFQGRMEACGPKGYNPPDFIKISEAYGVKTIKIDGSDYNDIRNKIKEILLIDESIVIDVNCHDFHDYNPKVIGWKTPIEDMYPYLSREEFLSNMIIDPTEVSLDFKNLVRPTK
jgi:acetolactate synthase-1/2/3 large subunit